MRNWIEKNNTILKVFLIPVSIIIGLGLISYFGVETRTHAAEVYVTKMEQEKTMLKATTAIERLDRLEAIQLERQAIDRRQIVELNNRHNIPTSDYPVPKY